MSTNLSTGDAAPEFELPADSGETVSLQSLKGNWVVLYFYPKDDTPGCTKEAIAFSEYLDDFAALGAKIFGVSKDSVAKHEKFKSKHDLRVGLLSDETGETCDAYGVWVEKKMYGKTYMGIERATFLISPDGAIEAAWRKVKVAGHAEAVLERLREAVKT